MMFKDEVSLLKEENKKQSNELREDDEKIINSIMKRMSIFKVNSYDVQVIKRDLIGMAQELKLRDSNIKDAVGENIKGFTDEIISNSGGFNKIEILLKFLLKLSGYFVVWHLIFTYGAYGKLSWDVNPFVYLLYFGTVIINFATEVIITPLFSIEKGFKKFIPSLSSIVLFIILTILSYLMIKNSSYTIKVYGGYIAIVSGLVYIVSKYLDIQNIHKLAKGKKNYIDDLIGE